MAEIKYTITDKAGRLAQKFIAGGALMLAMSGVMKAGINQGVVEPVEVKLEQRAKEQRIVVSESSKKPVFKADLMKQAYDQDGIYKSGGIEIDMRAMKGTGVGLNFDKGRINLNIQSGDGNFVLSFKDGLSLFKDGKLDTNVADNISLTQIGADGRLSPMELDEAGAQKIQMMFTNVLKIWNGNGTLDIRSVAKLLGPAGTALALKFMSDSGIFKRIGNEPMTDEILMMAANGQKGLTGASATKVAFNKIASDNGDRG